MTQKELVRALDPFNDDAVIVCADENNGWDNIIQVKIINNMPSIVFGGGSPFSDE